jgi:hypothetical protein
MPLASEPPPELEPDPELPPLLPLLEPAPELLPLSVPPSAGVPVEPPQAHQETRTGAASTDRTASALGEDAAVSMPR